MREGVSVEEALRLLPPPYKPGFKLSPGCVNEGPAWDALTLCTAYAAAMALNVLGYWPNEDYADERELAALALSADRAAMELLTTHFFDEQTRHTLGRLFLDVYTER